MDEEVIRLTFYEIAINANRSGRGETGGSKCHRRCQIERGDADGSAVAVVHGVDSFGL
jgi:hypothetical protein